MEIQFTSEKQHGYLATSRTEILQALMESKLCGNVVGVVATSVREGIFLCAVREICRDEDEDDFLIILNQNIVSPASGDGLTLYLSEIKGLCTL